MTARYTYPVSEDLTEPVEFAQDAGKRDRERDVIAAASDFAWRFALDFGCGRGANFPVLAAVAHAQPAIVGLDPDAGRITQCEAWRAKLTTIDLELVNGDIATVEDWPSERCFDCILICQVLGHLPVAETARVLREARRRLSSEGRIVLLYPFVTDAASGDLCLSPGEDYLHLVDTARKPLDARFRTRLTRAEFDTAAASPGTGLLPVRCFRIGDPGWLMDAELPAPAETPPGIAEALAGMNFHSQIYSVHVSGAGKPLIGDMATIAGSVGP
jgi:SAM-dependent methyltransferase